MDTGTEEQLHVYRALIDEQLRTLIQDKSASYCDLFAAAGYSLHSGGKRLRPLLTLVTCLMLRGPLETALIPACAIEMIHTYSLIHDDLPCMDNDDFRRGKPTLHRVVSEGLALLAGDYLLTRAFEILTSAPSLRAEQKLALLSVLTQAAGGHGMIGGQVLDLTQDHASTSLPRLEEMHRLKTGALFGAAMELGAIVADASAAERRRIRHCGQQIGLAFQILDDVLDITNSVSKHGRARSGDQQQHKFTYVTAYGIEGAEKKAQEVTQEALNELSMICPPHPLFLELIERCVSSSVG